MTSLTPVKKLGRNIIASNNAFELPNLRNPDDVSSSEILDSISEKVFSAAKKIINKQAPATLGIIAAGLENESSNIVTVYNNSIGNYRFEFKILYKDGQVFFTTKDPTKIGKSLLRMMATMHLAATTMEMIADDIRKAGQAGKKLPYGYEAKW